MKHKKTLGILVLLILIAFAIYYIYQNINDFKQLSLVYPFLLIILVFLVLFHLLITGLMNYQPLRVFNVKLAFGEIFSLAIITRFYNLITPFKGGMAARAVYLKKKHKFPYTDFLATLAASYVLIFLVVSLIGIISTLIIFYSTGVFSWIIFLIFLAVFFPLVFIITFSPKFPETRNYWINRIIRVINGWHLIKDNKKVIFLVSFLSLIQLLIGAFMLYLQFRVFGIEVSYTATLFLAAIASIGLIIGLTPAGLGVSEAIIVFSALTIGIAPAESLSAALLGRAVSLVVLFVLGPIFSYVLIRKKSA